MASLALNDCVPLATILPLALLSEKLAEPRVTPRRAISGALLPVNGDGLIHCEVEVGMQRKAPLRRFPSVTRAIESPVLPTWPT